MNLPSEGKEGFGIVAIEGIACGCSIIAADAGGLTEAVNNFGKFFEMDNQQQLEYLLNSVLKESNEARSKMHNKDLNNYLNAHKNEEIAKKYLLLFN